MLWAVSEYIDRNFLENFMYVSFSGFNISSANFDTTEEKAIFYHRLIETFKHGYAKRSYLGDSDFIDVTGVSY